MKTLASAVLAFGLFSTSASAFAEVRYSVEPLQNGNSFIFASGEFEFPGDTSEFTQLVTQSGARAVVFDSPGGNIHAAMKLGRAIRQLGLSTIQIKQLECSSACALSFMGGVQRMALPGSIGVHRSSFATTEGLSTEQAVATIQALTADLISYMSEMGVDPSLLQLALSYDQGDMRYLSLSEMAQFRVTTEEPTQAAAMIPQPQQPAPPPPPSQVDRRGEAYAFVKKLVEDHTDNYSALSAVRQTYSNYVDYYGKVTEIGSIVSDKTKYFARWPERAYRIREDTVSVVCISGRCTVTGVYDWAVRSVARNRQASGSAHFTYTLNANSALKIIGESGEVIR